MDQKVNARPNTQPRKTIRRSDDYKRRLSEASELLAEKMQEKRNSWDLK